QLRSARDCGRIASIDSKVSQFAPKRRSKDSWRPITERHQICREEARLSRGTLFAAWTAGACAAGRILSSRHPGATGVDWTRSLGVACLRSVLPRAEKKLHFFRSRVPEFVPGRLPALRKSKRRKASFDKSCQLRPRSGVSNIEKMPCSDSTDLL